MSPLDDAGDVRQNCTGVDACHEVVSSDVNSTQLRTQRGKRIVCNFRARVRKRRLCAHIRRIQSSARDFLQMHRAHETHQQRALTHIGRADKAHIRHGFELQQQTHDVARRPRLCGILL